MSNIDKQALREVAVKATALNLDTAQLKRRENESCECPVCFGEGYVDVESDYCNIDGVALGVLFYGIGEHHGLAETFFRAANPATVLALLDELDSANGYASAYEAEKWHYHGLAESEGERADRAEKALEAAQKRIAELEAREINLPPYTFFDFKQGSPFSSGAYCHLDAVNAELSKLGIKFRAAGIGKGE